MEPATDEDTFARIYMGPSYCPCKSECGENALSMVENVTKDAHMRCPKYSLGLELGLRERGERDVTFLVW